jgi:hypothetical protein
MYGAILTVEFVLILKRRFLYVYVERVETIQTEYEYCRECQIVLLLENI